MGCLRCSHSSDRPLGHPGWDSEAVIVLVMVETLPGKSRQSRTQMEIEESVGAEERRQTGKEKGRGYIRRSNWSCQRHPLASYWELFWEL